MNCIEFLKARIAEWEAKSKEASDNAVYPLVARWIAEKLIPTFGGAQP